MRTLKMHRAHAYACSHTRTQVPSACAPLILQPTIPLVRGQVPASEWTPTRLSTLPGPAAAEHSILLCLLDGWNGLGILQKTIITCSTNI